jgi:hypothetical protein
MAIDVDAEIEAARQNLAELDRLRKLGEPRPQSIWLLTAMRERVATRRLR